MTMPTPETQSVLQDIVLERWRQIQLWGHNEDTPDGTGPNTKPLAGLVPYSATSVETLARRDYEHQPELTWMHFLREEFFEAMKEDDPAKLYTELIQVAAVATSWCEKIRIRG